MAGEEAEAFRLLGQEHGAQVAVAEADLAVVGVGVELDAEHLLTVFPVSYTHLDVYKRQV